MPTACVFPLPIWHRKRCSACGEDKEQQAFGSHPSTNDGLRGCCNACRVKQTVAYHRANPEGLRVRRRRWKKRHPEKVLVDERRRKKLAYPRNAVKTRARVAAYQAANPEKIVAYRRSERGLRAKRLGQQRRLARAAALPNTLTNVEWEAIVAAFDGLCAYGCGRRWEDIEHVVALSKGGGLTADNVVPACERCNSSKHARSFQDFCAERGLDAREILARALSPFRSRSDRAAA